jgi:hypothetical protein
MIMTLILFFCVSNEAVSDQLGDFYKSQDAGFKGSPTSDTFSSESQKYTIKADFIPITYKITVTQGAHGAISPGTYNGFKPGASQTYTITSDAGYHIDTLTVDGNPVNPPVTSYPFSNITANHTIATTFAPNPTYTITATASAGGSIIPGTTLLLGGQSQKYTIIPSSDYKIKAVTVDGVSKGSITSYTFYSVNASHAITASFESDEYTITSSFTGSGTITPLGIVTVSGGGGDTFTITPAAGYKINYVAVNGASVGVLTKYTFSNVRQNYTIKADFVPITYKITVTQGANGTVSPDTYSGFKAGASQTYTITPNAGYTVSDVLVDGSSVGPQSSYAFSNITANHTISATLMTKP